MLWQHAGSLLRSLFCPRPNSGHRRAMDSGAAFIRGASQPAIELYHYFNFIELDEEEEEASRNKAMLVRRVLNSTYRSAARSWESRSSSGGSWMLFPPAGEHATSADGSSGSMTFCVSSSSSSQKNYWSTEVPGEDRSEGDPPATLGAQDSGGSVTSTPKGTKNRSHLCKRAESKYFKLQQYLRRESEQSPVELAAVTFSGNIGTVELTDPELLVSPPPPRARSTPPLRGPTWQQGGEADFAATTARRKLQKELGELNADRQGAGVAPTQSLPWAPRHGRRSLSRAATR